MRECNGFYVGGQWVAPAGTQYHEVINPATEAPLGRRKPSKDLMIPTPPSPRYVVIVPEPLPHLATGKISKRELKQKYANAILPRVR